VHNEKSLEIKMSKEFEQEIRELVDSYTKDIKEDHHKIMTEILEIAEFLLKRQRDYYTIKRFFLEVDKIGVKRLYCETLSSNEEVTSLFCCFPGDYLGADLKVDTLKIDKHCKAMEFFMERYRYQTVLLDIYIDARNYLFSKGHISREQYRDESYLKKHKEIIDYIEDRNLKEGLMEYIMYRETTSPKKNIEDTKRNIEGFKGHTLESIALRPRVIRRRLGQYVLEDVFVEVESFYVVGVPSNDYVRFLNSIADTIREPHITLRCDTSEIEEVLKQLALLSSKIVIGNICLEVSLKR